MRREGAPTDVASACVIPIDFGVAVRTGYSSLGADAAAAFGLTCGPATCCPSAAQVCPDCGHLFLSEERDEQRRGLQQVEGELVEVTGAARHRPKPRQPQKRPRRTHPAAGCRNFEELLQREQERGYKPGWARHVWAARQRTTTKGSTL